ncbi:VOC family protein [Actinomadura scrupuli]|uniref:VOC family protein n=1 Tax=Actinomadura scrupuli TaxID=559629 RepID=UPI003D95F482
MSGPELIQATAAARDLATATAAARSALGLPAGFPDPELASWGMVNEILNLGRSYLEIIAPSGPDSPLHRFLTHGEGGYVVGVRVPDTGSLVARAAARGVQVAHRQEFHGADIVQLHPGDLGVMLEADRIPAGKHWHYDDWAVPGRPGGAPAGDLLAVDVAVAAPARTAGLWAFLLGAEQVTDTCVQAGGLIRFVPVTGRRGLVAADLYGHGPAREHLVAGLTVRLVPGGEVKP